MRVSHLSLILPAVKPRRAIALSKRVKPGKGKKKEKRGEKRSIEAAMIQAKTQGGGKKGVS